MNFDLSHLHILLKAAVSDLSMNGLSVSSLAVGDVAGRLFQAKDIIPVKYS